MTGSFASLLASAAEEGRDVITMMLLTGLVFVLVIAIGEAAHYVAVKRREQRLNRPL